MPLATTYKEPPKDSAKHFAHFKAMDQQHCDSQFVSRCTIIAKCKIMYPLCIVWALLCVYSIFVFFVIWFQCTLSLGSTFDAWSSWICVAKCCCVPYNVLCCLVLAAFPVFCFSLSIALVDAWCAVWKCVTKNCVLCALVMFCVPCVLFTQPTASYCVGWCLRQWAGWIWVAKNCAFCKVACSLFSC